MTPYHELRVARPKLSAMLAKETHVSHVQRIWSIVILLDSAQSVGDKVAEKTPNYGHIFPYDSPLRRISLRMAVDLCSHEQI